MTKKKLPEGIQFIFANLDSPDNIEMQVDLHVYLGDEQEYEGEPVLYRIVIEFNKNPAGDKYLYSSVKLYDNHNIEPYDHKELEKCLKERLDDILENCTLNVDETVKVQLNKFLSEYGGSDQRFLL